MANNFKTSQLVLTKQLVTASGNSLYVNGVEVIAGVSGNLTQTGSTLFNRDIAISGGLEARIFATGNSAIIHANGIGAILSGNLTQSGIALFNRDAAISGGLEARIAQSGQSSFLATLGASGTLQGQINNLPTTAYVNGIGINLSGNLTQTGAVLNNRIASLSGTMESKFVHRTGNEIISGNKRFLNTIGTYDITTADGAASIAVEDRILYDFNGVESAAWNIRELFNAEGTRSIDWGNYLMYDIDGIETSLEWNARVLSGEWKTNATGNNQLAIVNVARLSGASGALQNQINNLPTTAYVNNIGINLSGNLTQTGSILFARDSSISGGLEARITTTGQSAITHANGIGASLSGNLTQSGSALINRDNAISGVLQTQINSLPTNAYVNGMGQIISGNLTQTGVILFARDTAISGALQQYINAIAAGTGNITNNVVFTTGTQLIGGTKYFVGNTYLDNVFITGTQTVVNTTDVYVGNNWMILNATGGARDSAIWISTGITGANATGGILGFDVPSNTWVFGMGGYQTDLSTLPKIASLNDINSASGGLQSQIYQSGQRAVIHSNSIGQTISGNLTQTGVTLFTRDTAISGGLEARIVISGNATIAHANSIGQAISGNLAQTGATLIARDAAISGGLEVRIAATGQAAWISSNGANQTISGQINSLSGYSDNSFDWNFYLKGGANDCQDGQGWQIVKNQRYITTNRGFTIRVFSSGGDYKAGQIFDVYNDPEAWNTGAMFITGNAATGDLITFVSHDAIKNAPAGGLMQSLAESVGLWPVIATGLVNNAGAFGGGPSERTPNAGWFIYGHNGFGWYTSRYSGYGAHIAESYRGAISKTKRLDRSQNIHGNIIDNFSYQSGNLYLPNGTIHVGLDGQISRNLVFQSGLFSGSTNIANILYPRSNPSGFITGLAGTGAILSAAQAYANGIGSNLSGNLTQTGSTLNSRINSLSGIVYPNSNPSGFINKFNQYFYGGVSLFDGENYQLASGVGATLKTNTGDIVYLRYDRAGGNSLSNSTRNFRPFIAVTGIQYPEPNQTKFIIPQTGHDQTLLKTRISAFLTNGYKRFDFRVPGSPSEDYRSVIIRPHTTASNLRFDLIVKSGVAGNLTGYLQLPRSFKNVQNIQTDVYVSFEKDPLNPNKSVVFISQDENGSYNNYLTAITGYGISCTEKLTFSFINYGQNLASWIY